MAALRCSVEKVVFQPSSSGNVSRRMHRRFVVCNTSPEPVDVDVSIGKGPFVVEGPSSVTIRPNGSFPLSVELDTDLLTEHNVHEEIIIKSPEQTIVVPVEFDVHPPQPVPQKKRQPARVFSAPDAHHQIHVQKPKHCTVRTQPEPRRKMTRSFSDKPVKKMHTGAASSTRADKNKVRMKKSKAVEEKPRRASDKNPSVDVREKDAREKKWTEEVRRQRRDVGRRQSPSPPPPVRKRRESPPAVSRRASPPPRVHSRRESPSPPPPVRRRFLEEEGSAPPPKPTNDESGRPREKKPKPAAPKKEIEEVKKIVKTKPVAPTFATDSRLRSSPVPRDDVDEVSLAHPYNPELFAHVDMDAYHAKKFEVEAKSPLQIREEQWDPRTMVVSSIKTRTGLTQHKDLGFSHEDVSGDDVLMRSRRDESFSRRSMDVRKASPAVEPVPRRAKTSFDVKRSTQPGEEDKNTLPLLRDSNGQKERSKERSLKKKDSSSRNDSLKKDHGQRAEVRSGGFSDARDEDGHDSMKARTIERDHDVPNDWRKDSQSEKKGKVRPGAEDVAVPSDGSTATASRVRRPFDGRTIVHPTVPKTPKVLSVCVADASLSTPVFCLGGKFYDARGNDVSHMRMRTRFGHVDAYG